MIEARRTRRLVAGAIGLTAALTLSGCALIPSLGDAIAPHVTSTPTATADGGPTYSAVDLGAPPANVTPPGTALAFGQGAWIGITSTDDTGKSFTEPVGIAVLDIVPGDATFWDEFQNAETFAGQLPYFVVIQQTFPNRAGTPEPPVSEDVWPKLANGSNAEFLTLFGAPTSDSCAVDLPDYDPATATNVFCIVGIGTADNPVTSAYYNGLGQFTVTYNEDDIYADNPLVWS